MPDVAGGKAPPIKPAVAKSNKPSTISLADASQAKEKEEAAIRIKAVLESWSKSPECASGESKEFPASLTPYERMVVHQWAEERGFQHRSVGDNRDRRIIVQKTLPKMAEVIPSVPEEVVPSDPVSVEAEEDSAVLVDEVARVELDEGERKKKKKKNRKPSETIKEQRNTAESASVAPKQQPATSAADLQVEEVKCPNCQKPMPKQNLALHQLRCTGAQEPSVRPKEKLKVKPLPVSKANKKEEDEDEVLSEFRKLDTICNYTTCKAGITLLGQLCPHCNRRFCLSHHMPEVHGCGDAIRRQVRSNTIQQGYVSAGSLAAKPKPIDAAKRAHLQRRLDKKIQDMFTKRAGKPDEQKKKK